MGHAATDIYSQEQIRAFVKRVFDWQIANPVALNGQPVHAWARAAFYAGVMAAFEAIRDRVYLEEAVKWAESRKWKLGERPRHADDQSPGQTFLEIYFLRKDPRMITNTRQGIDEMLRVPKRGRADWSWCDALFMSAPVFARLYAATRNTRYLEQMSAMWWDTTAMLYDPNEHLYYRDANYVGKRSRNGKKIFWCRGNGWVIAGVVRVLQYLPRRNAYHRNYVQLLKQMAATLRRIQGEDGLWRPSLLDPEEIKHPDTSGSAFVCYAVAWGIRNGYLSRSAYLALAKKAWKGLVEAVHPNGKLGWVQPIGLAPAQVTADDYQEYGSGAFLMAASEMYKLKS